MRFWVLGILSLSLLAGCLSDDDGAGPTVTVTTTPGPTGIRSVQSFGNQSTDVALPPEFLNWTVANVHTGFQGAEPNIGVTPSGAVFATAWGEADATDVIGGPGAIVRSTDGGKTWELVYTQQVGFTSDPMLWVDTVTGRIFSPQMFPTLLCSNQIWSDDDGETWLETPLSCGAPVVDHQKLATGPVPAGSVFQTTPLYTNLVTYCYNKLAGTFCSVSVDGGITYQYDGLVDSSGVTPAVETQQGCGGLNGHQHHAADGTIYVPYGFNCGQAHVAVSTDGGFTWTAKRLGFPILSLDSDISSTPDGTVYGFFKGDDGRVYAARSRDRFDTVEGPFLVSPPEVTSTAFLATTAGSDGRVAFSYLGSNSTEPYEDDAAEWIQWHLYVTMTLDGETDTPTFVTVQVTPDSDPVQRGSICQLRTCTDGNRNLLDFIDMHMGPDGRYWVAYADGCTSDSCLSSEGTPQDSRDDALTVAYLASGPSLLADVGEVAAPA